MFDGKMLILF